MAPSNASPIAFSVSQAESLAQYRAALDDLARLLNPACWFDLGRAWADEPEPERRAAVAYARARVEELWLEL